MKKTFPAICGLLLALFLSACAGQETQLSLPPSSESLSNVETSNSNATSNEAVSSSQTSVTSSKETSAPAQEPVISPKETSTSSQEPVTSSQEPVTSSQEPVTSSKETSASSQAPTTPEKKPSTPPKEPTVTESTPSEEPLPPPQPEPPSSSDTEPTTKPEPPQSTETEEDGMSSIQISIGNQTFTATLETNSGAKAFAELLKTAPLVLTMRDYSGFEKVADLGTSLPTSNQQITTQSGDIVLYNGNQIVIFYGSNSWSYTRLGRIDDRSGWETALGSGDVTVTFSQS